MSVLTESQMIYFLIIAAVLLVLGIFRYRKKPLKLLFFGLSSSVLILLAGLVLSIGFNLYTYSRLTYEQSIARLSLKQLSPQRFRVRIQYNGDTVKDFDLWGDEWQLDARILKWHGVANLLGLNTLFRLERISGRYSDLRQEKSNPRSVYGISENPGIDLWNLAQNYRDWFGWIQAVYGNAAYLPMVEGADYDIKITQSGLLSVPLNDSARNAVQKWQN